MVTVAARVQGPASQPRGGAHADNDTYNDQSGDVHLGADLFNQHGTHDPVDDTDQERAEGRASPGHEIRRASQDAFDGRRGRILAPSALRSEPANLRPPP